MKVQSSQVKVIDKAVYLKYYYTPEYASEGGTGEVWSLFWSLAAAF